MNATNNTSLGAFSYTNISEKPQRINWWATNMDNKAVTNLSLVGSMVIDVCMTCERDLVLPASCDKSFLADRTI